MPLSDFAVLYRVAPNGDSSGSLEVVLTLSDRKYESFLSGLGISPDYAMEWLMTKRASQTEESPISPRFPTLSQTVFMYVDPIIMGPGKLRLIVEECNEAIATTDDVAAKQVLKEIKQVAQEAAHNSSHIEFGHP